MIDFAAFSGSVGQPFVDLWNRIVKIGPEWLVALAIIVVAWILSRLIRKLVQKVVGRTSTEGHIDILIARGVEAVIIAIGVILALSEVGMSLSVAMAALGLMSVGIGFALKDILGNLLAGVILLVQHPFTIGDQVRVGEQEGTVENVRVRDTQVLTYDGERVFIPNQTVFNSPIINYTSTPTLRNDIRIGIKYAEDIEKARQIAVKILSTSVGTKNQPRPVVLVESEEEYVALILRFWVESDRNRNLKIRSDIVERLLEAFQADDIDFLHEVREGANVQVKPPGAPDETQEMEDFMQD
ncbi:MAG: mechanosensitive ion channel [Actinobacteria bacterium]|nr:mechanosensitive ion channel [Actinomycetota bacterium]